MDKIKQSLVYSLLHRDAIPSKFFIALASIIWGIEILNVTETYVNQPFYYMALLMDLKIWAAWFILHACVVARDICVPINKTLTRWIVSISGFTAWTSACVCAVYAYQHSMAAPISVFISTGLVSWWLLLKTKTKQ